MDFLTPHPSSDNTIFPSSSTRIKRKDSIERLCVVPKILCLRPEVSFRIREERNWNDNFNNDHDGYSSPTVTVTTSDVDKPIHKSVISDNYKQIYHVETQIHNHPIFCSENGKIIWHKGIDPNFPKGYYCCLNILNQMNNYVAVHTNQESDDMILQGVTGSIGVIPSTTSILLKKIMDLYHKGNIYDRYNIFMLSANIVLTNFRRFAYSRRQHKLL